MYPSQTAERFQVRMPEGLRARLTRAAHDNRRSMNAELVFHLERSLPSATAATGDMVGASTPAAAPAAHEARSLVDAGS